jgi:hypothetical protein
VAEKRRKPASKMTSDEIARHVFPPEVHEHLKRAANPDQDQAQEKTRPHPRKSSKSP